MKFLKFSILAAFSMLVWACGETPSPNVAVNSNTANVPAPTPADDLAMGREIYAINCVMCHKRDGTGGKITIEGKSIDPEDLTSESIKKFTDDKMIGYIYNGIEDDGMPAFKDKLSEPQIREVVRFIREGIQKLPPQPVR